MEILRDHRRSIDVPSMQTTLPSRVHNPTVNYTSQPTAPRDEDEDEDSDKEFTYVQSTLSKKVDARGYGSNLVELIEQKGTTPLKLLMEQLRRRRVSPSGSWAPSRDDYTMIFYPPVSVAVGGDFRPPAFPPTGLNYVSVARVHEFT
ncbi:hypothetical protein Scep_001621 [Stephania cephalantha]|uniref:Uncharacterized protein n=1 Tax=Stephania cephalantha TaxID=152367 RepID=A0AAP0L9E9_9MAGN